MITYSLACGLEQVVDYILNLRFGEDEIEYLTKQIDDLKLELSKERKSEKDLERTSRKTIFICALLRLYACIASQEEYRNAEEFLTTKNEVLECAYWKDVPELTDFRKWVENITPEEHDADRVMDVLQKYNKPE